MLSCLRSYEEALACFDEILKADPKNYGALRKKGATLTFLGRNKEALACFEEAYKIYPDKELQEQIEQVKQRIKKQLMFPSPEPFDEFGEPKERPEYVYDDDETGDKDDNDEFRKKFGL